MDADGVWHEIFREVKETLWGEPEVEPEMFYEKFSPVTGEVVAGWNFDKFTLDRMAGLSKHFDATGTYDNAPVNLWTKLCQSHRKANLPE